MFNWIFICLIIILFYICIVFIINISEFSILSTQKNTNVQTLIILNEIILFLQIIAIALLFGLFYNIQMEYYTKFLQKEMPQNKVEMINPRENFLEEQQNQRNKKIQENILQQHQIQLEKTKLIEMEIQKQREIQRENFLKEQQSNILKREQQIQDQRNKQQQIQENILQQQQIQLEKTKLIEMEIQRERQIQRENFLKEQQINILKREQQIQENILRQQQIQLEKTKLMEIQRENFLKEQQSKML